jgi:hypothetical protein
MRRSIIAAVLFLLPLTVQAQIRGGGGARGGGGGHAMISAPRAAAPSFSRTGGPAPVYRGSATPGRNFNMAGMQRSPVYRGTRAASQPSQRQFVPDFTGVPGLGFDWVHYAATHPGNGRGNRGSRFQGYFPFFDSGFLLPYADSYDYADGPAQTAAYDDDAPAPPDPGSGYVEQADPRAYAASRPAGAYDVVVKPPNPNDAYIFVKRDGSVFFAVAYSWDAGSLAYVTQEGVRRSVAREDLDLHATQEFNQQRGFSFQLPAA